MLIVQYPLITPEGRLLGYHLQDTAEPTPYAFNIGVNDFRLLQHVYEPIMMYEYHPTPKVVTNLQQHPTKRGVVTCKVETFVSAITRYSKWEGKKTELAIHWMYLQLNRIHFQDHFPSLPSITWNSRPKETNVQLTWEIRTTNQPTLNQLSAITLPYAWKHLPVAEQQNRLLQTMEQISQQVGLVIGSTNLHQPFLPVWKQAFTLERIKEGVA